jgi:hypothetical protein
MKFNQNPYYSPELCGLKILHSIDTADSYEFNLFVVWLKLDDNTIYWDTDSGCSCPSPFDSSDHGHDLKEINDNTYHNFQAELKSHYGISQQEILKIENSIKDYMKKNKNKFVSPGIKIKGEMEQYNAPLFVTDERDKELVKNHISLLENTLERYKEIVKEPVIRDLYGELRIIGLTHDQCSDVMDWLEKLPIEVYGSNISVNIEHGIIKVKQGEL